MLLVTLRVWTALKDVKIKNIGLITIKKLHTNIIQEDSEMMNGQQIWCVGDSFTVGIGQPFEEIWPRLLQTKIGKRCVNISRDGMSNDTIASMIKEIVNTYNPKNVVVMWSYFNRRRVNDLDVHHNKNDFGVEQDLENFCKNYKSVEKLPTNIIHTLIPNAFTHDRNFTKYAIDKQLAKKTEIIECQQLDRARDGSHFDIKTSELISTEIKKLLKDDI